MYKYLVEVHIEEACSEESDPQKDEKAKYVFRFPFISVTSYLSPKVIISQKNYITN